jgi:hypothetical protein
MVKKYSATNTVLKVFLKKYFFCLLLVCFTSYNSFALNYYWVGGTGNWSDLSHWATTSGGTVLHTQIPTAVDDVYFDGSSFNASGQVVTFNSATVLCKDMNWTGVTNNPSLNLPNSNLLKMYGSLTFVSGTNISFFGKVNFEATSMGKTITMAGNFFRGEVFFNGIGGEWT